MRKERGLSTTVIVAIIAALAAIAWLVFSGRQAPPPAQNATPAVSEPTVGSVAMVTDERINQAILETRP